CRPGRPAISPTRSIRSGPISLIRAWTAVSSTISRGMIPTTRPTKVSPPLRNTPMKSSAHWPSVSLTPATGRWLVNSERSGTVSTPSPAEGGPCPLKPTVRRLRRRHASSRTPAAGVSRARRRGGSPLSVDAHRSAPTTSPRLLSDAGRWVIAGRWHRAHRHAPGAMRPRRCGPRPGHGEPAPPPGRRPPARRRGARGEPDGGGHRRGVGEHRDPLQRLGRGDAVVGPKRDDHEGTAPDPAGRGADGHPAPAPQGPGPGHEPRGLGVGERQLDRPEHADEQEDPSEPHGPLLPRGSPEWL